MISFLPNFVVIMLLVVGLGFFNEKVTKITDEIALMLYSIIIGAVLLAVAVFISNRDIQIILERIQLFDLEKYLMDCVLCFMLFAGSCHMKLWDFERMARQVGVLSFLCTLLGALLYGFSFYGFSKLLSLNFSLPVCLMFGSIVAPTDPIAATSILSKFGLPKKISFLMEGESLLNDGVGVALFVCFSGIVRASHGDNVLIVLLREVLGAAVIGFVISALCIFVFAKTADFHRKIFASLLAVAAAYMLCEIFSCSGAIASVVCGIMFSTVRRYEKSIGQVEAMKHFDTFWDILDNMLNSVLYVILGLSFVRILQMPYVMVLSLIAVICNCIGRAGSLALSVPALGEIPEGYDWKYFTLLFTWGGLRGGLSIALAMSTAPMLDVTTYRIVLGGTYAIVFFTTVIQGLTMQRVYSWISGRVAALRSKSI
ncbi:MAG: cation:proton antiporter [Butyrivibrio sp.]|nr:cation:proton antiporter [Butyrivibrio sp.]